MINLIKKLQIISIILIINSSAFALTSSSFLISQSAYENYDYSSSLLNFDIDEVELYSLRRQIGIVPQEPLLFSGTIRENISRPMPNSSMDRITWAAKKVFAHEEIESFPDGYETFLEENASNVSTGMRQKFAIARALMKKPDVLIFDEATSSVDNKTENLIQKSLKEISKNRTTIAIAHRLSTIRNADQILVLENGKIIESGTHDELVALNGNYKNLWDLQTGKLERS